MSKPNRLFEFTVVSVDLKKQPEIKAYHGTAMVKVKAVGCKDNEPFQVNLSPLSKKELLDNNYVGKTFISSRRSKVRSENPFKITTFKKRIKNMETTVNKLLRVVNENGSKLIEETSFGYKDSHWKNYYCDKNHYNRDEVKYVTA